MPRHFLNFRRSAITKINFRVASLGNINILPQTAGICKSRRGKRNSLSDGI